MTDISISAQLRSSLFKSPITAEAADYIDAQAARIAELEAERDAEMRDLIKVEVITLIQQQAREDALREAVNWLKDQKWNGREMQETDYLADEMHSALINKEPKP